MFKSYLNSSSSNQLKFQVELSTSTSFTNAYTATSSAVSPGSYATTTISNLANGSYYWRARALDTLNNATSSWRQFGEDDLVDFVVNVASPSYVEISDGSVKALYHLENASDTTGAYDLTNHDSTAFVTSDKLSKAADQGSNNTTKYLSAASNLGVDGGPVSLAAWVNFNSFASGLNIFLQQDSASSQVQHSLIYNSTNHTVTFERNRNSAGYVDITENVTLSTSVWYHFVATYDGTNMRLYRDGSLAAGPTAASGNGSYGGGNTFDIGAYESGNYPSSAKLDEVLVTNTALPTSTIAALYNGGAGREVCTTTGCGGPAAIPVISTTVSSIGDSSGTSETQIMALAGNLSLCTPFASKNSLYAILNKLR